MDEMKIKTPLLTGLIAKVIKKQIYKNTGVRANIVINDISLTNKDGKTEVHLDVKATAVTEDITSFIEKHI